MVPDMALRIGSVIIVAVALLGVDPRAVRAGGA